MGEIQPSFGAAPARQRLRDLRRLALLEAAEAVFAEHGYQGAKTAEIAARAGYSAGSLYNSFEGKEDLFRAVLTWRGEEALDHLSRALDGERPLVDVLARFSEAAFGFWSERRAFFRIFEDVTHGVDWNEGELGDATAHGIRRTLEDRFQAHVERALERGELAGGDPEVLTAVVFGALSRVIARWMHRGGDGDELPALLPELESTLQRALGVQA